MKKVIAIIRPNKYYATKEALVVNGFMAMSVNEVVGRGKKRVEFELANGAPDSIDYKDQLVAKKWIEVYIRDEDEQKLIQTIFSVNATGNSGDGKIFVVPVGDCIRIRTGERSDNALM